MRALVIGAGVAGLACATELCARGAEVTVLEQASGIGPESCSWWAGGMLAPWCEGESAEEPVVRLGQEAADWWRRHTNAVSDHGTLVLALGRDASELRRFARRTERHETVDAERIATLEPDLASRFRQGLFFKSEAHLDPRAALVTLAEKLRENGASLRFGEAFDGAGDADVVVDCRGLAARETLSDLRGVKGEMVVIETQEIALTRTVRLLHPRIPLYIVPRGDGRFMIGATTIESGEREGVSVRSMLELLGSAYALHPAFAEARIVETGVDARPAFPDNCPRIRRRGKTLLVNGLYRHGFLLAPAMARMAADAAFDPHHVPELMDENRS